MTEPIKPTHAHSPNRMFGTGRVALMLLASAFGMNQGANQASARGHLCHKPSREVVLVEAAPATRSVVRYVVEEQEEEEAPDTREAVAPSPQTPAPREAAPLPSKQAPNKRSATPALPVKQTPSSRAAEPEDEEEYERVVVRRYVVKRSVKPAPRTVVVRETVPVRVREVQPERVVLLREADLVVPKHCKLFHRGGD